MLESIRRYLSPEGLVQDQIRKLLKKDDYSRAKALLLDEISRSDKRSLHGLRRQLALVHSRAGDVKEAQTLLEQMVDAETAEPEDHWMLGFFLLSIGKARSAIPHLRHCVNVWPQNSATHSTLGVSLLEIEDHEQAEEEFDTALSLSPIDPNARFGRSSLLVKQGKRAKARSNLEEYVDIAPNLASSHGLLAEYLFYQELSSQEALPHYELALELAPTNNKFMAQYWITAGYPRELAGSYVFALLDAKMPDLATKFVLQRFQGAEREYWKGLIKREQRNYGSARGHFERAVRLEPDNPLYLRELGVMYCRSRDWDQGFEKLDQALAASSIGEERERTHGAKSALMVIRGDILGKRARAQSATSDYLKAALQVYELESHWDEVLATSSQLITLDADDVWAQYSQGQAYLELNDFPRAIDAFTKLTELVPRWFRAWEGLANATIGAKKKDLAKRALVRLEGLPELTHSQTRNIKAIRSKISNSD